MPQRRCDPVVKYVDSITTTDSHTVNKLLSKWISAEHAELGQQRFHVASWCTQHMTGSAIQEVTVYLGLTRPGYALASCLATGEVADDVDAEIRAVLADELEVLDPAELEVDAPDSDNMMEFLSELFEQCYVQASGHSTISLDVEEQEQTKRQEKKDI